MKRLTPLIIFLAVLSVISGYLFSKMSWIGRVGVNLMYTDYTFLKVWWQGAIAIFVILMALTTIQYLIHRYVPIKTARPIHMLAIFIAIFGLYYTYHDFQSYYAHRWLKEKFHLGAYLFWIGWMIISFFYLLSKKSDNPTIADSTDPTIE